MKYRMCAPLLLLILINLFMFSCAVANSHKIQDPNHAPNVSSPPPKTEAEALPKTPASENEIDGSFENPEVDQPTDLTRELLSRVNQKTTDQLKEILQELTSVTTRHRHSVDHPSGIRIAEDYVLKFFNALACGDGQNHCQANYHSFQDSEGRTHRNTYMSIKPANSSSDLEVVVISGHLDSRASSNTDSTSPAPGANDDGSGVAVIMELASILAAHTWDVEFIFLATAHEEYGGLGSKAFASKLKSEGRKVKLMLTNDIVGSGTGKDGGRTDQRPSDIKTNAKALRLFSDWTGQYNTSSKAMAKTISKFVHRYQPQEIVLSVIPHIDRKGRWGDHLKFLEAGFPGVRLTQPFEDYRFQHQNVKRDANQNLLYGDTIELIDFDYLTKVLKVNLAIASFVGRSENSSFEHGSSICGNNIKESGEVCDHGHLNGFGGQCTKDCSAVRPLNVNCSNYSWISTCYGPGSLVQPDSYFAVGPPDFAGWLLQCKKDSAEQRWCLCSDKRCSTQTFGTPDKCEATMQCYEME